MSEKYCPLLLMNALPVIRTDKEITSKDIDRFYDACLCRKEGCAWWVGEGSDGYGERCAILRISTVMPF